MNYAMCSTINRLDLYFHNAWHNTKIQLIKLSRADLICRWSQRILKNVPKCSKCYWNPWIFLESLSRDKLPQLPWVEVQQSFSLISAEETVPGVLPDVKESIPGLFSLLMCPALSPTHPVSTPIPIHFHIVLSLNIFSRNDLENLELYHMPVFLSCNMCLCHSVHAQFSISCPQVRGAGGESSGPYLSQSPSNTRDEKNKLHWCLLCFAYFALLALGSKAG